MASVFLCYCFSVSPLTLSSRVLRYDSPRAVSCVAASPSVTLWKVDQATFRCLLARKHWDQQQYVHESIRNIDAFATLEEATVRKFVDAMTPVYYKAGDVIVRKGEVGNVFYSIVKGRVKVHDIGLGVSTFDDIVLEEGGSFGERALLTGEPRAANVTAITDVIAMAMDRTTFEACVGPMKSCLERDCRRQCLAALPIFKSILPPEIESLVDLMTEICYRKGAKLVEAGTMYDPYVWIIREGDLLVFSNKNPDKIFNLHGGDHFGDKSIRNPGRISSHTAIAETELTTWVLTQHDIESVIGDIDRLGETTRYSLTKKARAYRLEDLKRIKMLGIGGYGRVWMVQHKEKQQYVFALKQISKRLLLDAQQVDSVMREKQLLDMLHHKFILHLVGSFQDQRYLYLLLPVIPGGELFTRLQERNNGRNTGGMHAKVAGFYAACVLEALMHFHLRQGKRTYNHTLLLPSLVTLLY
jgi:cGMP-dependent protein kinase